ncbi:MAG: S8 family peptidase [Chloroflexota bacterium]
MATNMSKIHPQLFDALNLHTVAATQAPLRVIVKFRANTPRAAAPIPGVVATHRTFSLIPAAAMSVTAAGIDALSHRDDVEIIWLDGRVTTMLDASVPLINVPQVWRLGYTGKGVKVGIVDTGIDSTHPDFAGRIVAMIDYSGEGPEDNNGHGTHVAGIIGGSGTASNGLYKGVAPECLLYSAKVLGGDGSGSFSAVMAGIEWAVQQGVQVINLSLGASTNGDGTDATSLTCDAAVQAGVCVCVAAGNSGPGAGTLGTPACARLVTTIGATDKADNVADFSSRGPTTDGRVKPDVCFPGVSIHAARAARGYIGTPISENYTTLSGTSMATPHAAGACALLLQANPNYSPQQIKDALMNSAKNLGLDANTQGKGRSDVLAALTASTISVASFTPTTLAVGKTLNVSITVKNGGVSTLQTQGPDPGFAYEEGDTFVTRGFPDVKGAFRVGIDFDGNKGIDHPYRWGLGAPLAAGQSVTVTGTIKLKTIQSCNYWAGLVQEQTAWLSDKAGSQLISVTSGLVVEKVEFSPISLNAGQVLNVSITVRNDGEATMPTQGPEPGFVYEEGDTYASRGFPADASNFRVGVDFDSRTGLDHPYRWGFGAPLGPGQSVTITGGIHLNKSQTQKYWGGLVQEYVAWIQDKVGATSVTVAPVSAEITNVTLSPLTVPAGQYLVVGITVKNSGGGSVPTQGPEPGFVYEEGETFISRGFPSQAGNFRVGIDFDNRTGQDHPYRWGLGSTLGPGETRTITGMIRLRQVRSQSYWAGLVNEYVAWLQDRVGATPIKVTPGATITAVTFSPTSLNVGGLLNVSITVRNDSDQALATQGPDPGFVYEEGDTFASRGFAAVSGNFRVGIDFDNRSGLDHPYRWGFGTPLAPGETRTITGAIRMKNQQAQKYWAGMVQEYVAWVQDQQGAQDIAVT